MTTEDYGKAIQKEVEGLTVKQGEAAYKAVIKTIIEKANEDTTAEKVTVSLPGFGRLNISTRKEYTGRNPQTGKDLIVKESRRASFAAYPTFKKAINKK